MDERVYTLAEKIDEDLEHNSLSEAERQEISNELKNLIPKDSVVLAQINPVSGDIKGNAKKALKWIKWAQSIDVNAVIFPEMYLIGYPIGDFIDRFPLIVEENIEWLNALASSVRGKTKVIIGFAEFNKEKYGKKYYNSVAVLSDGKIEKVIRKTLLPNYAEFNERLETSKSFDVVLSNAQRAFNEWTKLPKEERKAADLMSRLDIDFSILLDNVTIARSRKHITKYYNASEIGTFPTRRKPISYYCDIAKKEDTLSYNDIFNKRRPTSSKSI